MRAAASPSTPRAQRSPRVVAGGAPDLIKPNDDGARRAAGARRFDGATSPTVLDASPGTLVPAARAAPRLVTLGARGAVLVTADGAWLARLARDPGRAAPSERATARSRATCSPPSRGAGDAERLRHAVRYGAAAASLPGTQAPTPADLPAGDVPVARLRLNPPPTDRMEVTVSETITPGLVSLDVRLGADKSDVIRALAARVVAQGRATDARGPLRRRVGARGEGRDRAARRHRDPARQERGRDRRRRSRSPG